MAEHDTLLPAEYTRYGKAVDIATSRILDVPIPIAEMWNPWEIPAPFLAYLAWGMSVDVWRENWPDVKKRSVIASSLKLHRLKGTLGGIRRHVGLLDERIVRAIVPPAKSYPSGKRTREEREAALRVLPQLRLYSFTERGRALGSYWGAMPGRFFTDEHNRRLIFTPPTSAPSRVGERAVLWDNGVITPLGRNTDEVSIDGVERIYVRGVRPFTIFSGQTFGRKNRFFVETTAPARTYTFRVLELSDAQRQVHRASIMPQQDPINTYPDYVSERGVSRFGVFCGRPFGRKYFIPTTAGQRMYRVIYLRDDARLPAQSLSTSFFGKDRFGIGSFTAELKITVSGHRSRFVASDFVGGFFYKAPKVQLEHVLETVSAAKAARDRVLVDTHTARPLTVGSALFIGAPIVVGSLTRA